jgi:hypothetical protein
MATTRRFDSAGTGWSRTADIVRFIISAAIRTSPSPEAGRRCHGGSGRGRKAHQRATSGDLRGPGLTNCRACACGGPRSSVRQAGRAWSPPSPAQSAAVACRSRIPRTRPAAWQARRAAAAGGFLDLFDRHARTVARRRHRLQAQVYCRAPGARAAETDSTS